MLQQLLSFNTLSAIVVISVIIFNLSLGGLVLLRNPKEKTNRNFFLVTLFMSWWSASLFFYQNPLIFDSLFWIRSTYIAIAFTATSMWLFSFIFPKPIFKKNRLFAKFFSILTIAAGVAYNTLGIYDVIIENGQKVTIFSQGYYLLYALVIWFVYVWSLVNLIINKKRSKGRYKAQLNLFIYGFFIYGFILSIIDVIIPIIWNNTVFFPISSIATIFFSASIAYVILKHRFFDIRLVIVRSVAYILTLVSLAIIYVALLFAIQNYIFYTEISSANTIIYAILTLFITLTFQPLKKVFQSATEQVFYRQDYDPQILLKNLSDILSSTLSLDNLTENFITALKTEMKIEGIGILLGKEGKPYYFQSKNFLQLKKEKNEQYLKAFNKFEEQLDKQKEKILIYDELEEPIIKETLDQFELSIVVPLIVNNQYMGGLLLKQKMSGDIFSIEDIHLLKIITPQLAVAINNALSYEEIKNFSKTLEQKVNIATADLREANKKLQKIDELKDEFVSVASHELRTPMTAIKNYLWLAINESPKSLTKNTKEYLEITYSSTERLIQLVNEMLIISRIEGGRFKLNKKEEEWNEVVNQIYKELKPIAEEKQINFTIKKTGELIKIIIDKDRIYQILGNLLGNALKFTPNKGEVSITISKENNLIRTDIKDTGPGIAPKDQTRLFSKFNRLEHSYAKVKEAGTGLGLYISQQIANLHKGKIEVVSKLDKGSTFTLILPMKSS